MAHPVKYFHSGMTGAPEVTNVWGALTAMLDAVLVNGFNLKTVDGITSAGGVATATSNSHGYSVGQVVLIEGADQPAYNGEHLVTGTTSNTFTFAVEGTPTTPATTQTVISAKVAPLGFEIAFTGTSKRAYRSPNPQSSRPFLRVDDSLDPVWPATGPKFAKVTAAEGMSDIDTFVGARAPFDPSAPTKNEVGTGSGSTAYSGWFKWFYAKEATNNTDGGSGTRRWVLIGDDRGFYLALARRPSDLVRAIYYFGDIMSFKVGDAFNCLLTATDSYRQANSHSPEYTPYNTDFEVTNNSTGKRLLRGYSQFGNPVEASFFTLSPLGSSYTSGRSTLIPFPNGPDFSLQLWPVWIREATGDVRGVMPGLMFIPHDRPFSDLTVIENVANYAGRKVVLINGAYGSETAVDSTRVAFDITGPWR